MNADEVIARIAALACQRIDGDIRFLRVGIDGRDGAGKTTLADRLTSALDGGPALILRSGIDGWHNPEAVRYRRGRLSPEGYYLDSFDLDHLKKELLDPLGPGGNREYRLTRFAHLADRVTPGRRERAIEPCILIFDGVFLLRSELADSWDLSVYVDILREVSLDRGLRRDVSIMGGEQQAAERYVGRYLPGQALCIAEVSPNVIADVVIENSDYQNPKITKFPTS